MSTSSLQAQPLSEHISVHNTQMAQVLTKIIEDKKDWLQARQKQQPLEQFLPLITPSDRDFYAALSGENTAFILECKKASPSKGLIRAHFDLNEIALVYRQYANAISVLTDEKYFQGNFDFLPQIRQQVSQPVLCKDFMIDRYQVYLARHYGADAILLMLSVLNDEEYRDLSLLAHELKMGVLTEVSNEHELTRALQLNAKVIGINNRNLRDLSTDLNRTKQLAPLIPKGIRVISESGIYDHQQVRDLAHFAHGFLIGSSLMAQNNLELAVRSVLLGENKVCGLTRTCDAVAAYQAGAVFGGLIFVQGSARQLTLEQAQAIRAAAPLCYVGVFQNQSLELIVDYAHTLGLCAVQLHGQEDQAFIDALREQLASDIQIWKAYGVTDVLPQLLTKVDRHLLDTQIGQQQGGTGKSFDWQLIQDPKKVMLAGGLNPQNAQQAAALGCLGLDFNSGVESAPGHKDPQKLQQVFSQLRHY